MIACGFARRRLHLATLFVALSGCATYADRLAVVRDEFVTGDLARTDQALAKKSFRARFDKDVVKLDRSIVLLAEGKPSEAEQTLREVRDRFDHLEQKAIGEKALSMLTDAQREAYAGEDYEKVLIRVFLALSNLMQDGQDAGAYALQVADKQQQIIAAGVNADGENPKESYQRVAVGAYLNGALREATHSNYDDVERSCAVVCSWQPEFPYAAQDLERARHGHHSAPGNGVLYIIALVGVGPHKEEVVELPSTVSLLIADRILSAVGNETLPPTIAPIKVPRVVLTPHEVDSIGVAVNGRPIGRTATITDVGRMAVAQYDAIFPRVMAEAVVRRIVKKGVILGAKEISRMDKYSLPAVALDIAGVAWEATESADTRCWGLLPDKIQVLRLELPAGQHQLTFQSLGGGGYALGRPSSQTVTIENGRNTYVLGNFPYGNLVGQMLVNTP
ncbi:MAG TPA: hypothetical protein VHV77_14570 [Pirellulales bacterium]|jgi:hypothetical protein|nr:hypothetical protein [Pirellulales bacterium]